MQTDSEQTARLTSHIYLPFASEKDHVIAIAAALQQFLDDHVKGALEGYVWHREPPVISVSDHPENHVVLTMRHGGSIEDEWLIVHLLLLATASPVFSEGGTSGLIASVHDEDGQFLLIEAADVLPNWISPSNADGRVWMAEGKIHLVSTELHAGDQMTTGDDLVTESHLRPGTALEILRSNRLQALAPSSILSNLVDKRMPTYPQLTWASSTQHSTLVYLPISAAKCFTRFPQLVADAVESFHGRDGPVDARHLRNLDIFKTGAQDEQSACMPSFLVKIKLTRRMYVILSADKYLPPKVFGSKWREAVLSYWEAIDRGIDGQKDKQVLAEGRRRDLGCKLTAGLELTYTRVQQRITASPRDLFDQNMRQSDRYTAFIRSLTTIGYFGSEIPDSYEWKQRESKAMQLWKGVDLGQQDAYTSDRLSFLPDAVRTATRDRSLPPHVPADLSEAEKSAMEDSDAFMMDLSDDDEGQTDGTAERLAAEQISAFSQRLSSFVEGEGDEIGALFDDEGDDDSDNENTQGIDREAMLEKIVPRLPDDQWGARLPTAESKTSEEFEEIITDGVKDRAIAGFSRGVRYDGASDSDESVDDDVLRAGETANERQERAKHLDIEAEYEDEERRRGHLKEDGDIADEDETEIQGDDEGEMTFDLANFLEFTRKELGLTEEQYADLLAKRKEEGKYIPDFKSTRFSKSKRPDNTSANDDVENAQGRTFRQQTRLNAEKATRNTRTSAEEKQAARMRADSTLQEAEASASKPAARPRHSDPFDNLMKAMDAELTKRAGKSTQQDQSTSSSEDTDEEMDDIHALSAEDRELLDKMIHSGPPASLQTLLRKEHDNPLGLSAIERQVMDGMLQSYQAQMGAAGPVGNLAGRLGFAHLPKHS